MIVAVHQPQYLPWLGYFDKIARSDHFVFLDIVQYKEREFQNRNKIRTQEGPLWLTVPVVSKGKGRQSIAEVKIDNSVGWAEKHWESLKTWYGHAAFFREHALFFESLYRTKWENLIEINLEIINYLLVALSISSKISFESLLDIKETKTGRIIEICKKLNADMYLSGIGGKEYLEEEKFAQAGIVLKYQGYEHPAYRQQYMVDAQDFLPCMSVIDLLFNEGPQSRNIILGQGG